MTDDRIRIDPELTRRRFLQGSALAGAAAFLAACGTPGTGSSAPSAAASAAASAPASAERPGQRRRRDAGDER